jgi:hypothetical protein
VKPLLIRADLDLRVIVVQGRPVILK